MIFWLAATVQCIAEAFSIDMTNEQQTSSLSIKPASLTQIFDVYLKTQAKAGSKSASAPAPAAASSSSASTVSSHYIPNVSS
jgi:small glutamine-rich tetratricopeptide repeat-containing protein alpha